MKLLPTKRSGGVTVGNYNNNSNKKRTETDIGSFDKSLWCLLCNLYQWPTTLNSCVSFKLPLHNDWCRGHSELQKCFYIVALICSSQGLKRVLWTSWLLSWHAAWILGCYVGCILSKLCAVSSVCHGWKFKTYTNNSLSKLDTPDHTSSKVFSFSFFYI